MKCFTVLATTAIQILGAVIPPEPPIFTAPCAILPPSNSTKLTSFARIESGATSFWGHEGAGGPKKWIELYVRGLTVIPYCFSTEEHRKDNIAKMEAAIELWTTTLGGTVSKDSGHKIMFSKWVDPRNRPRYCIDVNSPVDSKWNMAVPYKTVAFWKDDRGGYGGAAASNVPATVGMGDTPGKPWDLNLWIDDASVSTIAHELGHVMGMMHEHQRSERDTYIRYDCMKLFDYSASLARARKDNPSTTTAELCHDAKIAAKYEFSGRSYTQSVLYGEAEDGWILNLDTPYDAYSIMHHHSYIMGNEKCDNRNQAECPVAVYRNSKRHDLGFEMIPMWTKPSYWDTVWVKAQYGWKVCCGSVDKQGAEYGREKTVIGWKELLEKGREQYGNGQM